MRKYLVIVAIVLLVASLPAHAQRAKVAAVPIEHPCIEIYQAYPGDSTVGEPASNGCPGAVVEFMGYLGTGNDVIVAAPGILSIVPGENWANYVGAAQAQVPYTLKNVVLVKETPDIIQCADVFPAKTIYQQGTPNIRLWWPLMYDVPCTTWTLTITYGTSFPWDDDGSGPNPAGYVHTEIWCWHLDSDLDRMALLLNLFHQLPFATDQVPLISDEVLFPQLLAKLAEIQANLDAGLLAQAGLGLQDFELEVMDACIGVSPAFPNPTGPGTGIAQTEENPACCKLLADAEYVGFKYDIFQPKK